MPLQLKDVYEHRFDLTDDIICQYKEHYRMETINIDGMFHYIEFTKLGSDIKAKAETKIEKVRAKIKERNERIKVVCDKYNITPAELFSLARLYAGQGGRKVVYNSSQNGMDDDDAVIRRDIPAGKVAEIGQEASLIEAEKKQVERLTILARNIDVGKQHKMNFEELQYLEF